MGSFFSKTTQVETTAAKESSNKNMEQLKHLAYELLGINESQFEALYTCIAEEMNDARKQDLARALRSMQDKMDQNSKEATTKLLNIVKKKGEDVRKELVATKNRNVSSEEILQFDAVKEDIRRLKEGAIVLNHQMKLREMAEEEIRMAKKYVKKTASEMNSKLQMKTDSNPNMFEMRVLKDDVEVLTSDVGEVREELESQEQELSDVQTAVKSLKDQLQDVTKELESVKDVATNHEGELCELRDVQEELRDVQEELRDVQEELRVVKEELRVAVEKTGGDAKDEQRELKEAGLRKEGIMDANFRKEGTDKGGSAQTDHHHHVQKVREAMTELEASSRDETAKLNNCNNMKRNRESGGYPTFEQNKKKLRKQSTRDEHGVASVSRGSRVYSSSPSSSPQSESELAASPWPSSMANWNNKNSDSESDDPRVYAIPPNLNWNTHIRFGSDSSYSIISDSDSGS